jgi:hypothetical protein
LETSETHLEATEGAFGVGIEIRIVSDKGGASVRGKTRGPAADKLVLELADRLMGGCRKEQETVSTQRL